MIKKLTNTDDYLVAGTVTRDAEVKFVGEKKTLLCSFSVVAGKREDDSKIFVELKAWRDLGGVLSELRKGDAFCGIGRLETHEYNGKQYSSVSLEWGNSPMVSAGSASDGEKEQKSDSEREGNAQKDADGFYDLSDEDDSELPF